MQRDEVRVIGMPRRKISHLVPMDLYSAPPDRPHGVTVCDGQCYVIEYEQEGDE